jgi:RNA polymerase sigma-70 factor (ECF subfamily)
LGQDGHVSDFAQKVEQQIPGLRRYARALVRDPQWADDLVQDCLVRALSRHQLWRRGSNLRAWLFTILHNLHANSARDASRRPLTVALDETGPALAEPPGQIARVEAAELLRALEQLPEEQRQAVLLAGLEGLEYREIAQVQGVPIGTVMSRLSRGRERLRRLMAGDEAPSLRRVK